MTTAQPMTARDEIAAIYAAAAAHKAAPLTAADMEILEFARLHWKYDGKKAEAVYERFGHSLTVYLSRLNAVLDKDAAVVYDAPTVNRELRKRASKAVLRTRTPEEA